MKIGMIFVNFKKFILESNDDVPESKLLGIQVDIDLEDKGKSSEDMS